MPDSRVTKIIDIPLTDLEIGFGQVRTREVGKDLDELAASIKAVGLLEPIVVCESDTEGKYEIITGQRRFLAHKELQEETIKACLLDPKPDEATAKVLSLTENMCRLGLTSRDLIDACTDLHRRYGSINAVVEETGLPYSKVSQYVKFDQLIEPLKKLVENEGIKLQTALRAQKAASVTGETNPDEAVEFAKEMSQMSGAQQSKIVKEKESDHEKSAGDIIEEAKSGGRVTQLRVTMSSAIHSSLKKYAQEFDTSVDDAACTLITEGLEQKGFVED